ncbi:TPA: right-handed parallel beta-helix repeat-containing protein [Acinetobacter baumannii]|uniref:right-handed parallel beta-helix repeat-containing protein n=1 Tax=Acinetobacter baumannii TaxID=470 RepID=UPI001D3170C3|nr:right-handed parallel beta-helix repeat-containing protein [Acinetobacter baumannii]EHU3217349.1 right-handed parallel beta-helix repeat-containing protein [Acinetobacter baumannii]MDC4300586.1 right-handed parallel beta-helix repeat-containing protein [Acinetobacter baumannii]MDC4753533.1 right-handed parallel beta-helix repeat-containing protein [Acinetobacter baumannii]MDC5369430.1 right-handed parallel beta-helix repeat-containing protein [Acinetobacter baumannii]MDH2528019.1 right-hand
MNFKHLIFILYMFGSISHAQDFEENTDITDQLNEALRKNKTVIIGAGNYKIDAVKSIKVQNNSIIKMSKDTRLKVIPNRNPKYSVFNIKNVKNVEISGGQIIGDKYTHLNNDGEWGMGFDIRDSQNISIMDMSITKMWGDGIYLGTNGENSNYNINFSNLKIEDNRRQGISIISVNRLKANNIIISKTKGKSPMNGIDIEPHNKKNILQNIEINNLRSVNNFAAGVQISLKDYNNSPYPISINISNFSDIGSRFGLKINGITTNVKGKINIDTVNLSNNITSNYCFQDWSNNNIEVSIKNLKNDKKYIENQHQWCTPYIQNKFLRISKTK